MPDRKNMNVLIIGGGYAGVACALRLGHGMRRRERGSVGLINAGFDLVERIRLHQLAAGTALPVRPLAPWLARAGVAFIRGHVQHIDLQRRKVLLRDQRLNWDRLLTSMGPLHHDLCIWTGGFSFPSLGAQAGLAVNAAGQVRVDPQWRALSHPEVYVAGDLASPVIAPGDPLQMGCKSAQPTGVHVAMNLLRELDRNAPRSFDMATPFHCVSLGRRDGLVQFPDGWGHLAGPVLTGRRAALFKETVSRAIWWSLALESRGIPAVRWMRTGYAPEQLDPASRFANGMAARPLHPPGV